jgi:iron(III) transport system substrate-binding protein
MPERFTTLPNLNRRTLLRHMGLSTAAVTSGLLFPRNASAEGKLVWYSGSATRAVEDWARMFQEKTGTPVEYFRAGGVKLAEKIEQESKAKRVTSSVFDIAIPGVVSQWARDGVALKYESPEAAHYPTAARLPGYWTPVNTLALCMAFNADHIKPEDAPKKWEDLLDPKWKGKMTMTDALASGAALHWYGAMRTALGRSFMEQLSKQDVLIRTGSGETVDTITSGERPLAAMLLDYHVFGAIKKGANLYLVQPDEGIPVTYEVIGIPANAPNPETAKKFVDFALSREAQQHWQDTQYMLSLRDDVSPPTRERGRKPLSEVKHLAGTASEMDKLFTEQATYIDEWTDLFK